MRNEGEALAAIAEFSRALQAAGNVERLRGEALLQRAMVYYFFQKFELALADANAAESAGALDLPAIIAIQSVGLAH